MVDATTVKEPGEVRGRCGGCTDAVRLPSGCRPADFFKVTPDGGERERGVVDAFSAHTRPRDRSAPSFSTTRGSQLLDLTGDRRSELTRASRSGGSPIVTVRVNTRALVLTRTVTMGEPLELLARVSSLRRSRVRSRCWEARVVEKEGADRSLGRVCAENASTTPRSGGHPAGVSLKNSAGRQRRQTHGETQPQAGRPWSSPGSFTVIVFTTRSPRDGLFRGGASWSGIGRGGRYELVFKRFTVLGAATRRHLPQIRRPQRHIGHGSMESCCWLSLVETPIIRARRVAISPLVDTSKTRRRLLRRAFVRPQALRVRPSPVPSGRGQFALFQKRLSDMVPGLGGDHPARWPTASVCRMHPNSSTSRG